MRLRRVVGAIVVAICVGMPLVEAFDRWDHTLEDGNDTEANLVIAALCIGFACSVVTGVIIGRLRAVPIHDRVHVSPRATVRSVAAPLASPIPTTSPPLPLRI